LDEDDFVSDVVTRGVRFLLLGRFLLMYELAEAR
jgi:hypothetical protein